MVESPTAVLLTSSAWAKLPIAVLCAAFARLLTP